LNEVYLTEQVADESCGLDFDLLCHLLQKYVRKGNQMLTFWNCATVSFGDEHRIWSMINFREYTFGERHSIIGGLLR